MAKAEKICRKSKPGARRDLKKKVRRLRRRAFKKLGEDAPTETRKFIYGWDD